MRTLIHIVILSLLYITVGGYKTSAVALPEVDEKYNTRLIEDSMFTGGFYMTAERIQEFLDKEGNDCEGELCLRNYRDADTGRSAAEIIYEISQELGLNPQVILVTLQKENSLITDTDPEPWQYRTAMGYGCPDNADCDADFFGFANQIRLGATLLRAGYDRACGDQVAFFKWRINPQWYRGNTILINGRHTYLANCATASLYNYTPHRVDSAWRDVDGIYYYGNYNFVTYFEQWFLK